MGYFSAITDLAAAVYGDRMSATSASNTNQTSMAIANADNAFNSAEAAKNRDFQEQMADTQMQRRVTDLTRAGLNPALGYTQGGAAAPSGSSASSVGVPNLQNPGAAYGRMGDQVSSALDLRSKQAQIDQMEAVANKTNVEAGTEVPARVANLQSQTGLNQTQATNVQKHIDMINVMLSPIDAHAGGMFGTQYENQTMQEHIKTDISLMDQQTQQETMNLLIKARNDENFAASIGAQNVYTASDGWFGQLMAYFKLASSSITGAQTATGSVANLSYALTP